MTAETRNMMGYDYAIADLEFPDVVPDLDYFTGDFMTKGDRLVQRLESDLVHI